ncbi:MAG: DUF4492 domain-containing protein [Flavobacteriales bacterium]|nr:DUF4492 domain-containing protein [Flavobacteriales bacterium]
MSYIKRIIKFYTDGFSQMTVGKTLWVVILLKLFIMFAILKVFFFPDFLGQKCADDTQKSQYMQSILSGEKP